MDNLSKRLDQIDSKLDKLSDAVSRAGDDRGADKPIRPPA